MLHQISPVGLQTYRAFSAKNLPATAGDMGLSPCQELHRQPTCLLPGVAPEFMGTMACRLMTEVRAQITVIIILNNSPTLSQRLVFCLRFIP